VPARSSSVVVAARRVEAAMPDVETTALSVFAAELRCWRQRLGWSQTECAEKIAFSASLVGAVETCKRTPTLDFARHLDAALGTPGTFLRLHELIAREAYPAWFAPVISFEREAVRIHTWEPSVVPGLLQTEAYARAIIRARNPSDSAEMIDRAVAARLERQQALAGGRPPMLWCVIAEGVPRQLVGGAEVMAEQLGRLVELAGMPGMLIQVLPFTASEHAGVEGPIAVYDFAEAPSMCYTECYGGGRVVEARDEVADLVTVLGMIRASALSPADSVEFIRKLRSEIRDR
jgi:transcriptional regulator with XRE-family HTH domain